ncbi:hypothetical protein [Fluviispira multicolorata]|uniref:Thiol-activated cytolysin n=1 Tax=Fluviispira multicolorata TaxID=2654512 RepID=A0A833N4B8_9BACT|nr:hypothetical protein [Fluviispira multicolorata]KAB8031866.1 hypothetical protein GCL57_04270 [Fluviispira multicolorata]
MKSKKNKIFIITSISIVMSCLSYAAYHKIFTKPDYILIRPTENLSAAESLKDTPMNDDLRSLSLSSLKKRSQNSTIPGESLIPALLGSGYDSNSQILKSHCVTGTIRVPTINTSDFKVGYLYNLSTESLIKNISGTLAGDVSYSIFSGNGAIEYAKKAGASQTSVSFTEVAELDGGEIGFDFNANDKAVSLLAQSQLNSNGEALNTAEQACGDSFVDSVSIGAKLYTTVKFSFKNESTQTLFKGKVKANLQNLGELNGEIKKLDDYLKKSFHLTVYAFQLGGDPSQLPKAISTENRASVTNCSGEDVDACFAILKNLDLYRKEQFTKQIANSTYDETKPLGLVALKWNTVSYAKNALKYKDSLVTLFPATASLPLANEVKNTRLDLKDRYLRTLYDGIRAQELLKFFLPDGVKEQLNDIARVSQKNRTFLADAAENCFINQTTTDVNISRANAKACVLGAENAYNRLIKYDRKALSNFIDSNLTKIPFNYTGFWQSDKYSFLSLVQTGEILNGIKNVHIDEGYITQYASGGLRSLNEIYMRFKIHVPLKEKTSFYCTYDKDVLITPIDKDSFQLREVNVDNKKAQECRAEVTPCSETDDRFACVKDVETFERI